MPADSPKQNFKTEVITVSAMDRLMESRLKVPPCLVLISGDPTHIGKQWNLDRPAITMGRTSESDIHLAEGGLSKAHARFVGGKDLVTVEDLGSTNKTIVNGKILAPGTPQPLKNNDLIQAGKLFFKFLQKGIVSETAEKARMQAELESARNLQTSLLPVKLEAQYQSVCIGGRYRSATEVGGDWWWHWSSGAKAFAIIGDVTGHGMGPALITSAARSAVSTLEDDANVSIDKVYATLTRALHRVSAGAIVMSAFIVEYEFKTATLRYINASHLPAVLIPIGQMAGSLADINLIDCEAAQPLGLAAEGFAVGRVIVPPASRLVLLTDGLTERKNAAGVMMRERSFYEMLLSAHAAHPTQQAAFLDDLLARSDAKAQMAPQDDDITVVALDFK